MQESQFHECSVHEGNIYGKTPENISIYFTPKGSWSVENHLGSISSVSVGVPVNFVAENTCTCNSENYRNERRSTEFEDSIRPQLIIGTHRHINPSKRNPRLRWCNFDDGLNLEFIVTSGFKHWKNKNDILCTSCEH